VFLASGYYKEEAQKSISQETAISVWDLLLKGKFGQVLMQKTAFLTPFIYKNDRFTKTGSGQT
jgi:hypothetical protein